MAERLEMLQRLVGEAVAIQFTGTPHAVRARIDVAGLTQVLLNLVVNARDAMEGRGRIELRVGTESAGPGDWVYLDVEDTGPGMEPSVAERACEPFFSTKDEGAGTGLGLSLARKTLVALGGDLVVDGRPGVGARIRLRLPRVHEPAAARDEPDSTPPVGGTERILVVEDDARLLEITGRLLERMGYRVDLCVDAAQARAAFETPGATFDLLFTDVTLPSTSGPALARALRERRPDLGVVFTSGYARDGLDLPTEGPQAAFFVPKPVRSEELYRVVRLALDG